MGTCYTIACTAEKRAMYLDKWPGRYAYLEFGPRTVPQVIDSLREFIDRDESGYGALAERLIRWLQSLPEGSIVQFYTDHSEDEPWLCGCWANKPGWRFADSYNEEERDLEPEPCSCATLGREHGVGPRADLWKSKPPSKHATNNTPPALRVDRVWLWGW